MSLAIHRMKENLGGVVHLLTIDASKISGRPTDVLRIINSYGKNGTGVEFQGNQFEPYSYEIPTTKKSSKANKSGAKIKVADFDLKFARFVDYIGGSLSNARIFEMRVYGKFLDGEPDANTSAYSKRMDHTVNYVEDSGGTAGELIIHTLDPLSRAVTVPRITFSAGEPNSLDYFMNVFPAASRNLTKQ